MKYTIALIKGDGIGPEIVGSAVRVLQKAGEKFGHSFVFREYLMGGCAIDASGTPLPEETVAGCLASDSVLLGAVGGPKWRRPRHDCSQLWRLPLSDGRNACDPCSARCDCAGVSGGRYAYCGSD